MILDIKAFAKENKILCDEALRMKLTQELFNELYIDKNMSIQDIAKEFNINRNKILLLKKEYCIEKSKEKISAARKNTNLKKYGVDNPTKNSDIKNKIKSTNLEKYGVSTTLKNPETADKIRRTNLERYGVENPFAASSVQNKIKDTNLKKYGVNNPSKSDYIKNKKILTTQKHFGCDFPQQSEEVRQKTKNSVMSRYGVINVQQNELIREKSLATNKIKYDVLYPMQNDVIKEKSKKSCLSKYGIENISQIDHNQYFIDIFNNDELFVSYINNNCKNMSINDISKVFGYSVSQIGKKIAQNSLQDIIDYKPHYSKYETEIVTLLQSFGVKNIERNARILDGKEIDIYIPDLKLGIEFNGDYWHSDNIITDKKYHFKKSLMAEKNGVRLIHIYEYEWNNAVTKNIIISLLRIATNNVRDRIYARNCDIRQITNKDAKDFNDRNHIQHHRNAQVTYGLYHKDELVQLMSFSKHKKYEWEIIRGCPGSNNIVIGGVGKLFKRFIKDYDPNQIFSYCDFNKFDGKSYEAIGMKFIGYTGPDKKIMINNIVVNRNPNKYKEYKELTTGTIWGAGSKKYLWTKEKTEN